MVHFNAQTACKLTLLVFAVVFSLLTAKAQQHTLSTQSAKAEKAYYKASDCYELRDYECAINELKKAIALDEPFTEAWIVLGDAYADMNKHAEAAEAYNQAIANGRTFYPEALFFAGSAELKIGLYEAAQKHFSDFLDQNPRPGTRKALAEKRLNSCNFALEALKNPIDFKPINMGASINSIYSEYFPCLTVDDKTLLFTRRLPDTLRSGREQEDFFTSTRTDTLWRKASSMGPPINTWLNEGAPTLSADGKTLIFTACAIAKDYGEDRFGFGSCDLFASQQIGGEWTAPRNIGSPVNTGSWETQPSISSDGKTLYFIKGITDRFGVYHQDIYTTHYDADSGWALPRKLPSPINTDGTEESVFIHPDGKTLYFSSDGHPGMGGFDIFVAKRLDDGTWSQPQNLGYPLNTYHDENSLLVSGDGKTGYFASDREGGFGKLDLYSFKMPENAKPKAVTYLKGNVFDEVTLAKLGAKFDLINLKTGEIAISSSSDPVTGEFLVALPSGYSYALNVAKDGYLFYSDHFNVEGNFSFNDPFIKDIPLKPILIGESVVLRNVFFETDKYELKDESRVELDRLAQLLLKNSAICIEVGGHTDNQGTALHNQELSNNRAKSVFEYLVKAGINSQRMTYKGYGETKPVSTNETDNGKALNRRTEFKITSL